MQEKIADKARKMSRYNRLLDAKAKADLAKALKKFEESWKKKRARLDARKLAVRLKKQAVKAAKATDQLEVAKAKAKARASALKAKVKQAKQIQTIRKVKKAKHSGERHEASQFTDLVA